MRKILLGILLPGCGGIAEENVPLDAPEVVWSDTAAEEALTGCARVKAEPTDLCTFEGTELMCATYEMGFACYVVFMDACYYYSPEELSCERL